MSALGEALPAKEEQTDEGRFQEEGHQTFNRERGAEDVAHVVRVVSPVCAKLEFHGDAGRNAQREVDAKELAPEAGHVFVDFAARHDVARLHDHQHERQAERKRHEQEVIHGRQRKLQTGQINKFRRKHRKRLRVSRTLRHKGRGAQVQEKDFGVKKSSVADVGSSIRAHQNAGGDILRSLFDTLVRSEKEVPKPENEGQLAAQDHADLKEKARTGFAGSSRFAHNGMGTFFAGNSRNCFLTP